MLLNLSLKKPILLQKQVKNAFNLLNVIIALTSRFLLNMYCFCTIIKLKNLKLGTVCSIGLSEKA